MGACELMKTAISTMKSLKRLLFLTVMASILATGATCWPQENSQKPRLAPAYPLKKSATGRYLEDQKGMPFLIAG